MVKGVNKNIIEVNDTGSEIFERIVFYVSPSYASLGAKALQKASDNLSQIFIDKCGCEGLRVRVKRKKRNKLLLFCLLGTLLIGGLVAFFCLK